MAFCFCLPNLLVVASWLRVRSRAVATGLQFAAETLLLASAFLGIGTYQFTPYYWGPAILKRLTYA